MPAPKKNAFPKLDDWKAPWEVDADGKDIPAEDQNLDPAAIKKQMHALYSDRDRDRAKIAELDTQARELEQQIGDVDNTDDLKKLQKQLETVTKERDDAQTGASAEAARLRVALRKGLTERQAERLVGKTEEELEEDADELLREFGRGKRAKVKEGEEEPEPEPTPRPGTRVRSNPQTAGDPDYGVIPEKKDKAVKPEDVIAEYHRRRGY